MQEPLAFYRLWNHEAGTGRLEQQVTICWFRIINIRDKKLMIADVLRVCLFMAWKTDGVLVYHRPDFKKRD